MRGGERDGADGDDFLFGAPANQNPNQTHGTPWRCPGPLPPSVSSIFLRGRASVYTPSLPFRNTPSPPLFRRGRSNSQYGQLSLFFISLPRLLGVARRNRYHHSFLAINQTPPRFRTKNQGGRLSSQLFLVCALSRTRGGECHFGPGTRGGGGETSISLAPPAHCS